jgi:hypothetical protein
MTTEERLTLFTTYKLHPYKLPTETEDEYLKRWTAYHQTLKLEECRRFNEKDKDI